MTETVLVRYIVSDVDVAIAFYTKHLGFEVVMHPVPAFAMLSRGALRLALSRPNSQGGGGQVLPGGRVPEPGGWNRISLPVADIETEFTRLHTAGVQFRSEIITGVGGKQVIVDDPAGNPVELFEAF
jgi:catechol 2,3-dioxygenase-like lactoylglutathione lyase family enzyme